MSFEMIPKHWKLSDELADAECTMILGQKRIPAFHRGFPNLGDETACRFTRLNGRVIANGLCDGIPVGIAEAEHAATNWARQDWCVYGLKKIFVGLSFSACTAIRMLQHFSCGDAQRHILAK